MPLGKKIAFLGTGNMAEAMVKGLLRAGTAAKEEILCTEPRPERREEIGARYGVQVSGDNRAATEQEDDRHDDRQLEQLFDDRVQEDGGRDHQGGDHDRIGFEVCDDGIHGSASDVLPDHAPVPEFVMIASGSRKNDHRGASVTGVSGSGNIYTVSVSTGSGSGTIRLNVVDTDTIKDGRGNPLGGTGAGNGNYTGGQSYTIPPHRLYLPLMIR